MSVTTTTTTVMPNITSDNLQESLEGRIVSGLTSTMLVVLASELGDKTFFLTTVMAMKHPKQSVFLGALTSALLMITLSTLLGLATSFIPSNVTHYVGVFLFLVFGVQMITEGFIAPQDEISLGSLDTSTSSSKKVDSNIIDKYIIKLKRFLAKYFSVVFVESFALTFFAEWGDRSQIALVLLAARENIVGMMIGATLGHVICLSLAVIGGGIMAKVLSPKAVNLIGGWIFLCFALYATINGPAES